MLPEVAAELGIPALLMDLILYGAAMLALWRVYRDPPDRLTRMLACALLAAVVSWLLVGTAFAGDMYRPWRYMADDYVMMMVIVAASFSLYWMAKRGIVAGDGADDGADGRPTQPPSLLSALAPSSRGRWFATSRRWFPPSRH
jgi:O-antigen ligase